MRSIWNGSNRFGLVSIPVKLYSGSEENRDDNLQDRNFLEENKRKINLEDNQVDSGSERNHQTDNKSITRIGEQEYCHQQNVYHTRAYEKNSINKRNQEEIKSR